LIIAISESTKNDILRFFKVDENKIRVVYQSFNPIFYKKLSPEQRTKILKKYGIDFQNFILSVGTIEERKNILLLLKAVKNLNLDLPIILIGRLKGSYGKKVKKFVDTYLSKQVFILQNVNFNDLPAFYQSAELFVYPSVYEGFGIPVIEAQQSEVPVITSKVSSLPEAAGPHSILIDPFSIDEMQEALLKILYDPVLKQEMILKGKEYVKKFSDENFARGLMNVYRELN